MAYNIADNFHRQPLLTRRIEKYTCRLSRPDRATECQQGPSVELVMTVFSRRSLFASALLVGLLPSTALLAADKPKEIRVDWATYNPVSMLLKDKGFLEKEFAKDGIAIRWVKTVSSSNALQFLNAGSIDFGSTAGSAALVAKINGNPIKSVYVYSRPEWTALVTTKDSKISKPEDLKGKKVAMVRGTDPHIFLVRTLLVGRPHRQGHHAGAGAAACGRRQPADPRRHRCLGRPRPDDGAARGARRRAAVLSQAGGQYLGHPQRARGVREGSSRAGEARDLAPTRRRASIRSPTTTSSRRSSSA